MQGPFDGLGLRGNDSSPVTADGVRVPASAMLGQDGKGFDIMMGTVLPLFNVLNAACSVGLMEAAVQRTAQHARDARYAHLDSTLADLPTIRNYIARMRDQDRHGAGAAGRHDCRAGDGPRRRDAPRAVLQGGGRRSLDRGRRDGDARVRRRGVPQGSRRSSGTSGTRTPRASWGRRPTCSTTSSARPFAACRSSEERPQS